MPIQGNGMKPEVETGIAAEAAAKEAVAKQAVLDAAAENAQRETAIADRKAARIDKGERDHDEFVHELLTERSKPVPAPPPPQKPTERQWATTVEEMEAGKRAVARAEAQQAARPVPAQDPGTGTTVPVFRPSEYVHETKRGGPHGK